MTVVKASELEVNDRYSPPGSAFSHIIDQISPNPASGYITITLSNGDTKSFHPDTQLKIEDVFDSGLWNDTDGDSNLRNDTDGDTGIVGRWFYGRR